MGKSYRELIDERADADAGEHLNVTIVSFDTEGQEIVGEFKAAELLESTKYDNPVQRYLINTDDGIVSCLLGSHTDKEVLPKLRQGDLIKITFKGQKDIGGGKTVNLFDVQSFGPVGKPPAKKGE